MPVVNGNIDLPDGSTANISSVVISAVGATDHEAPVYVSGSSTTTTGRLRPSISTSGAWSLDLPPTSLLTPSGSVYRVETKLPGQDRIVEFFTVPVSGPVNYRDYLADEPQAVADGAVAHVNTVGDEMTGRLEITGAIASGASSAGIEMTDGGLVIAQTYIQTAAPTDLHVAKAVHMDLLATVSDNGSGFGPAIQPGWFGSAAAFQLDGRIQVARNQTGLSVLAYSYGNQLVQGNDAGNARNLTPAWNWQNTPFYVADGAKVTQQINDTARGSAAFIDWPIYMGADGGEWDGVTNECEHISYLSYGLTYGDANMKRRIAFDAQDVNTASVTAYTDYDLFNDVVQGVFSAKYGIDVDEGAGTWDEQIILRIPFLDGAVTKNIGISNGSTMVYPPQVATISNAGSVITRSSTLVRLNNTSGGSVTLTSTPTIADGQSDGQWLSIVNTSANPVSVQDEGTLTGSNLQLGAATRTLAQHERMDLVWLDTVSAWCDASPSGVATLSGATFTGPVTYDDATQPGKIALASSILGHTFAMYKASSDAQPSIQLYPGSGAIEPTIALGAGGSSILDWALSRAGAGIATLDVNDYLRTQTDAAVGDDLPRLSQVETRISGAHATLVPLSMFDANTILKADSNDTPEALTVAEQRIVGRVTSGEITALTPAEVISIIDDADGSGSGLDADLLDGFEASAFPRLAIANTFTEPITIDDATDPGSIAVSTSAFGHALAFNLAAGDANASMALSGGALGATIQMGAGGANVVDWTLARSAANVARLASGDWIRAQTDATHDEDLVRYTQAKRLFSTVSVSNASTLTMLVASGGVYVATGTTATYTLPALAANTGVRFEIKNCGSGNLTIQRAGSDELYTTSAVTSAIIAAGGTNTIVNDGTYWLVL